MSTPLLDKQDVTDAFTESMEELKERIREGKDNPKGFVQFYSERLCMSESNAENLLLSLRAASERSPEDSLITVAGCLLMGFQLGLRAAAADHE